MRTPSLAVFSLLIIVCVVFADTPEEEEAIFDGQIAYRFLLNQVEMGPRIPGTPAHDQLRDACVDWFEECEGRVEIQEFSGKLPRVPHKLDSLQDITGYNILAHFGPSARRPSYVVASHYDTRPWSDKEEDSLHIPPPTPGANCGASGVAVLPGIGATICH